MTHTAALDAARHVVVAEAAAVAALGERLDHRFEAALDAITTCRGRVIVSGLGKSGHIGRKIAATLASLGSPAHFVHAAEALHGDAGMLGADDVLLALSNSGETAEVCWLAGHARSLGCTVIAMTGCGGSSALADAAHVHLDVCVESEADPHGLAPTTSTAAALALGDALAVAASVARDFAPADFAARHPGGALGRRLARDTA
jgi:arabinose-5-phosphate isomerase